MSNHFSFTDISDTLKELAPGIKRIMSNPSQALDLKTYVRFYTLIHDHVLYDKENSRKKPPANPYLAADAPHCSILYHWLDDYLKSYLVPLHAEMAKQSDQDLVLSYPEQWNRYKAAAKYNCHIFRYLERHWIMRLKDEGDTSIHSIFSLHMIRWKENILQSTSIGKVIDLEQDTGAGDIEQPTGNQGAV